MPNPETLRVSLQLNLKLQTFLDAFDVLDYPRESKDEIAKVIQEILHPEDQQVSVEVEDICFAGQQERRPPTVVEYFEDRLGIPWPYPVNKKEPASPSHPDFHIETPCGRDCANAIDAAVEAIRHVRKAFGNEERELVGQITQACSAIVRCYVYG